MQRGPTRVVLLNAVTATQASLPVDVREFPNITIYLNSSGTTSGGTIVVEEADWDPQGHIETGLAGPVAPPTTWSLITTINASTLVTATQTAFHLPAPACYSYVRVRIATTITGGGTVGAALRAN